jgi:thimet oligopeptidase
MMNAPSMLRSSVFMLVCSLVDCARGEDAKPLEPFRAAAERARVQLILPVWERTPEAISASAEAAIAYGNEALDRLGRQHLEGLTLQNTASALDDIIYQVKTVANRFNFMRESHPDPKMVEAAANAATAIESWLVTLDYRTDVYRVIEAFAATKPRLDGEDKRLLEETLRSYRRAGLSLPSAQLEEVKKLRQKLTKISAEFASNIANARGQVAFTRAELQGLPQDFFIQLGVPDSVDAIFVDPSLVWQCNGILENATREDTRHKIYLARETLARQENACVLNQMLALRNQIAHRLGYSSWADYQTEVGIAGSAAKAEKYVRDLAERLGPQFAIEVATLQRLKARQTGEPRARINTWDWQYYQSELTKEQFGKAAAGRVFPFEQVFRGVLDIYGRIFEMKFERIEPTGEKQFQVYVASDAKSCAPLGIIYFDLFTRDNKQNIGGESEIIGGKLLPNGLYQRPVAGILLNFPAPRSGTNALLTHAEIEILFHEFGHAAHEILTQARYARFAGTNVPRDFVEAPAEMLQYWVWNEAVLKIIADGKNFAASKAIVREMNKAKRATAAIFYRRQCAFALLDLALHGPHSETETYDAVGISNPILERVFLPIDPGATFVTAFRALDGYDAAYYGYVMSDAIAADMATVFERSKDGYLDASAGMRLRREIYEKGNSRPITESIEKFLGRPLSRRSFLEHIGAPMR